MGRAVLIAALLAAGPWGIAAQRGPSAPLTSLTRPLSPSVVGTFNAREQEIELVVLWRGAPGWFLSGSHSDHVSERGDTVHGSVEYAGQVVRFSYERERRRATINDVVVSLLQDTNVILVDRVDAPSGPVVAGLARLGPGLEGNPTMTLLLPMTALLRGSPEVVSFLQCDRGTPNEATNRAIRGLVCDALSR
jgi:hypothetical protein